MKILYISYDGMLEPLGQSQVLAYLKMLSEYRKIYLISFEKSNDWSNLPFRMRLQKEIADSGIKWFPLRYHKRPTLIATLFDILCGLLLGLSLCLRYSIHIIHARSYVSALIALVIKNLTRTQFLFDMRGFWADEKLDSGWSRSSLLYRISKRLERHFFLNADHVISLTYAAVPIIQSFDYLRHRVPPITVIPTCADLTVFKPISQSSHPISLTIGYVGTASNWYLFDETVTCFLHLLDIRPETNFLIVNRNEHSFIRSCLLRAGVPLNTFKLISATPKQMPNLINMMDASILFIKPCFSKQASAATKLGELLGCGIPCLSNTGVGDMAHILEEDSVGVALRSFDQDSMITGINQLLALVNDPLISKRCVRSAHKYFSLKEGVKKYSNVYDQIMSF